MLNRRIKIIATVLALLIPLLIWTVDAASHREINQTMLVTTLILFVAGMFNVYRLRAGKTHS